MGDFNLDQFKFTDAGQLQPLVDLMIEDIYPHGVPDLEIILGCLGTRLNIKIYSATIRNIYTLYLSNLENFAEIISKSAENIVKSAEYTVKSSKY